MTVSSEDSSIEYDADGVTVDFAIPFPFFDNSDIQVSTRDADGDPTVLATGFTITGAGTGSGNCNISPAIDDVKVILQRVPQILQQSEYVNNDRFPAKTNEFDHDRDVMLSQYLLRLVKGCIRFPTGDESYGDLSILASASARKSTYLGFDSQARLAVLGPVSSDTLSQENIGLRLYPMTAAEVAGGSTIVNPWCVPGSIVRYGAVGDGVTVNTAAIDDAIAQAKHTGGAAIYIPTGNFVGNWVLTGILTGVRIYGDGMQLSTLTGTNNLVAVIAAAAGASIWGLAIDGLNIVGGLDGIHLPTGLAFPPFICSISNTQIQGSARHAIYDQAGAFTLHLKQIFATNTVDHAFDILGGNTVVIEQCYPAVVPTGTGKAGYRIHGGQPLFIGCNGVNTGDYWGIFGDTVAEDGILRYCSPIFDRCNIESFTVCGVRNKNGGMTVRNGTQFVSHLANNVAAKLNLTNKAMRGFLENDSCFVNTAGGWLNTSPVHTTDATAIPFSVVFSPNANDTFDYYDEFASASATVATVTSLAVVSGVLGYGIYNLYTKGTLRHGAGGSLGVFGSTPIVQPTTASGAAAFVASAGTAVNDASTFGGYTLKQVVKALQNLGLLA